MPRLYATTIRHVSENSFVSNLLGQDKLQELSLTGIS